MVRLLYLSRNLNSDGFTCTIHLTIGIRDCGFLIEFLPRDILYKSFTCEYSVSKRLAQAAKLPSCYRISTAPLSLHVLSRGLLDHDAAKSQAGSKIQSHNPMFRVGWWQATTTLGAA